MHQSVKQDFLGWYYEAAKDSRVVEGLEADNSDLIRAAQESAQHAESLDDEHPIIELLDLIEEYTDRAKKIFYYIVGGIALSGCGVLSVGIISLDDFLFRLIAVILGSSAVVLAAVMFILYQILAHQLRTSAEIVAKFNKELTEKPGDVRRNDRFWPNLAAQYFWNKSLCRPATIHVLVLLAVIRTASSRLYGGISGDIHYNIQDFIGMDGRDVLKYQFDRLIAGDYPGERERSDYYPEPMDSPPRK